MNGLWTDGPMDRQTDGWMDGWTDGWTHPLIEMRGASKNVTDRPMDRWMDVRLNLFNPWTDLVTSK